VAHASMTAPAIARIKGSRASTLLLAFLSAYFVLQAALRIASLSSLGLDDAEMAVITQEFAAGYGSQPPLYNWIQILATDIFGLGVPAFVITHFLLLWLTFVFMFLSARVVLEDDVKAAAVALALFTLPQIGWEAQRALTHSVLSITTASFTLYVALVMLKTGSWGSYLALGLALALGVLSKYSYVPFALALLIAAATIPSLRPRILSVRFAAALLLMALLLVPHLHWVATHEAETLSRTRKFKIQQDTGLLLAWGEGLFSTILAAVSFAAASVLVFAIAAFSPMKRAAAGAVAKAGPQDLRTLILRMVVIALALVVVMVLATRVTYVKDRWLQCLLIALPLALFILFEDRLTPRRQGLLIILSALMGLGAMAGLAVASLDPDLYGDPPSAAAPFGAISEQIRAHGFEKGYVLADNSYIAGNLKLHFPESTVAEPEYGLWPAEPEGQTAPVLLVWSQAKRTSPPGSILRLLQELCGRKTLNEIEVFPLSGLYEHSATLPFRVNGALVSTCPAGRG
jgi:4-amino-4-deoxy-L-arabinose transferase-like glycosyltransferase